MTRSQTYFITTLTRGSEQRPCPTKTTVHDQLVGLPSSLIDSREQFMTHRTRKGTSKTDEILD